ncbi:hypothetical protein GGQ62_001628 [Polymorphobacter fuscus]|nr:hypothetical protein [Polymorphobacter fuscus]
MTDNTAHGAPAATTPAGESDVAIDRPLRPRA